MAQIDRIRADLAKIAARPQTHEAARQAVQRRIAEFVTAARTYYAGEPDGDDRVVSDLTALASALAREAKTLPAGSLSRAYHDALDAMLAAAREA